MSRGKVPLKLIECPKSRNATFIKRRKGLKKKTFEFATLCGVDVCFICFGLQGDRQQEPEIWPNDPFEVRRIIKRYGSLTKEQGRHKLDLLGFLEERNKKLEHELNQRSRERATLMYNRLSQFSGQSLLDFLATLDLKIDEVGRRIELIKYQDNSQGKQVVPVEYAHQTYLNQEVLDMYKPIDDNERMMLESVQQRLPITYMKPMELSCFPHEDFLPLPVGGSSVNPGIGTLKPNLFRRQNEVCDSECSNCKMRFQASVVGLPSSSNLNSGSIYKLLVHPPHHMKSTDLDTVVLHHWDTIGPNQPFIYTME